MWNEPTKQQLGRIPRLYETDNTNMEDKIIYLHFFLHGSDWYVVEYDGEDSFFGYAILNDDIWNAEWGYFSFSELKELKVGPYEVECDKHWKKCRSSEDEKISIAHGWGEH